MIRPTFNRIVIKPIFDQASAVLWTPEEESRWGNGRRCTRGEVVATGPLATFARIGDIVHFSDSCLRPFEVEGEQVAIIRDDDIVGAEL